MRLPLPILLVTTAVPKREMFIDQDVVESNAQIVGSSLLIVSTIIIDR